MKQTKIIFCFNFNNMDYEEVVFISKDISAIFNDKTDPLFQLSQKESEVVFNKLCALSMTKGARDDFWYRFAVFLERFEDYFFDDTQVVIKIEKGE